MALQIVTNINVDFYDKKYTLLNAKQLDKKSRFLSVTCYNHGEIYSINAGEHSAYIRYKKYDNNSVFNFCEIDRKGKILVELTEQMLASDGICYADLVIVNKGSADVDVDTGEIVAIDNASILSTMTFCIDVSESPVANSDIESSYEYDGLNVALEKAEAEYSKVIRLAKSYAMGDAGGIRENEDTDNAKYYYEQSRSNANIAESSAKSAMASADAAAKSEINAKNSADSVKADAQNAKASADAAKISEQNAKASADAAANSEINAKNSETNALSYKETIENVNNSIIDSINTLASNGNIGSFIFMGSITFDELTGLSNNQKATGYVYCVTNDFTTTDNFINGAGKSYTAGTNVYYTSDGKWDCLGSSAPTVATLEEVKEYLGI